MRCVYPDCDNTSRTRGLCHGHYQTMRARVRALGPGGGAMLEGELVLRGLLLPKGSGGSPAPDTFDAFRLGSDVRGQEQPKGGPIWGCLEYLKPRSRCAERG